MYVVHLKEIIAEGRYLFEVRPEGIPSTVRWWFETHVLDRHDVLSKAVLYAPEDAELDLWPIRCSDSPFDGQSVRA